MSSAVETGFLDALGYAESILLAPPVGARWTEPSALALMDVGSVAGHLFLVVRRVVKRLEAADAHTAAVERASRATKVDRVVYRTIRVTNETDLDHEAHRVVRDDGAHVAAWGWEPVCDAFADRVSRLRARFAAAPLPAVTDFGGHAMAFDAYLESRVVEVLVHADDLATSCELDAGSPPATAVDIALGFLVDIARREHGDLAVLRSFTRHERLGPRLPSVY
ncbi:MAG: hypothetical protein AB7L13_05530 [Acidimicrobiia bacterium]